MSDLTERLRHAHVHSAQRIMGSSIFEQAADEIDRLTRELAEAREFATMFLGWREYSKHGEFPFERLADAARALKEKP